MINVNLFKSVSKDMEVIYSSADVTTMNKIDLSLLNGNNIDKTRILLVAIIGIVIANISTI